MLYRVAAQASRAPVSSMTCNPARIFSWMAPAGPRAVRQQRNLIHPGSYDVGSGWQQREHPATLMQRKEVMLVGIDVSSAITSCRSGVGNYTLSLITQLQQQEATGEACFFYFSNRGDRVFATRAGVASAGTIYPYDRLPWRLVWMQACLPRSIARIKPDLCHFPNHLSPVVGLGATPYLLTIHDMSVYHCPQYHTQKTIAIHRAVMPGAARQARIIVTVSESARQDILHYLRVSPDRVRVVYEGVGPQFQPVTQPDEPRPDEVRWRYSLPERYILTVSTLEPRKNHLRLMDAFRWLVQQERVPHHLVIAGTHGWKDSGLRTWVEQHRLTDRIHFTGYVADADLPGLYRSAEVFAFPSLYEGFGLPVLEAMASGVPCLISTDPALGEIAGTGNALAVDPYSRQEIATGLYRLLSDPELSACLRTRGLARVAAFSWQACADETYRLYREVAEATRAPVTKRAALPESRQPWLPADSVVPSRS